MTSPFVKPAFSRRVSHRAHNIVALSGHAVRQRQPVGFRWLLFQF
jgi:hypothetical protein